MMSDIIFQVVLAAIPIVGLIIATRLIPLINSKLTKEQRNSVMFWTEIAVVAIEKYYGLAPGQGTYKKEFVMDFLINELKMDRHMTDEQLSAIIDAVVENIINQPNILTY